MHDAPAVQAPFDPTAFPSLHGLVVTAAFGLALAASLGAAARRPAIVAAAVAIGVGFPGPSSSRSASALRLGVAALGAVLWAAVVLSVRDARRGLYGVALTALVALVSGGVAAAGLAPGAARVDWRGWDPFAGSGRQHRRQLPVGRELLGDRLSRPPDRGAPDTGPGTRAVLADVDARDVRRRSLDRAPVPGRQRRRRGGASRPTRSSRGVTRSPDAGSSSR